MRKLPDKEGSTKGQPAMKKISSAKLESNWTPFPNNILDNLRCFTGAEIRVFCFMVRKTLGWMFSSKKPNHQFSVRYIIIHLKMGSTTAQKAIQGLLKKEAIVCIQAGTNNSPALYEIKWELPEEVIEKYRVPETSTPRVPEMGTSSINQSKETILREPEKQGSLKAELKLSQQERMPKPKKGLSADTLALVLHWNECCQLPGLVIRPSVHRITPASKTMKTVDTYIQQLQAGTFVRHCTELTPEWCAAQKINHAWQNHRWNLEELKAAVTSYFLMFRGDHWPDTKAGKEALPTGLPGFMYSPRARQRRSYLLHVAVTPPKAVAKVEDPEVMEALVKCYTKVAHKPDQAERRTIEEAANGLVYWHRRLHRGVVPLCSLEFDKTYRTPKGLALKFAEFMDYLYNNDRADMICHPGMFKPGSKTWTAFLHFCEDQYHVPINVDGDDPEGWAWKYVENTVRGFARKVEAQGLERARVLCGNRIPYFTIEQCDQRKANWIAEHGNQQWGRGVIREVLKGRKL